MKQECKMYSNKLTKIKSILKKQYYAKKIRSKYKQSARDVEVLRTFLPDNSTKSYAYPTAIDPNGRRVTDQ